MTEPEPPVDGRSQRRTQNTDLVVDAMLDLLASGNPWPSGADIAEKAGLSERSVFRYFDDLDTLARAAVERQVQRANPLFEPLPADGTRDERIDRLVAHRLVMFDQVGAIVQAARMRSAMYEAIAIGLAVRRSQLRRQLQILFATEVEGEDDLLAALEVVSGLESLQALRVDRGLSARRTARILHRSISALLA
ncbi:MAG TPA: TetR/AcrR family transcriptional regulator [Acidimicrobiales bacterium]|jgi:AcrR family transcriptional regulator